LIFADADMRATPRAAFHFTPFSLRHADFHFRFPFSPIARLLAARFQLFADIRR
jgi:hypothetical protein